MQFYIWNELNLQEKKIILARPSTENQHEVMLTTKSIIAEVKQNGDKALFEFTKKFDRISLSNLKVSTEEMQQAWQEVDRAIVKNIEYAYEKIKTYHQQQISPSEIIETSKGVYCQRQARSIEKVGLYIPGGSAPLISTVLMLGIPAQIANCDRRILCTPPNKQNAIDPYILVAAKLCNIDEIYKVGGAQAIAAMAYGTESVPKVDKIFGPGNRWVTQAKMLVSQDPQGASIDLPAGPSELLVIADDNANPNYVAADLLSQAEHGAETQVILIAFSEKFLYTVEQSLTKQLEQLSRREIIAKSLEHCRFILADSIKEAINITNDYAPEHLILQISNPEKYLPAINNAGAVFLGPWSSVSAGDYITGSNHVLPTSGFAKIFSGLSVNDFMKFISIQKVTQEGLNEISQYGISLAEIEGLPAHARAMQIRLEEINND